jgi:integrator complex subunit 11
MYDFSPILFLFSERDLLRKVHDSIEKGGKVLIPVFAVGRAQELCILLETYWERMNLKVPIYFAVGLTEKVRILLAYPSENL